MSLVKPLDFTGLHEIEIDHHQMHVDTFITLIIIIIEMLNNQIH